MEGETTRIVIVTAISSDTRNSSVVIPGSIRNGWCGTMVGGARALPEGSAAGGKVGKFVRHRSLPQGEPE